MLEVRPPAGVPRRPGTALGGDWRRDDRPGLADRIFAAARRYASPGGVEVHDDDPGPHIQ